MPEIVWYHYIGSPVAHKVGWYLKLRGLPYTECVQSPILPRPDVIDLLGVGYRRIPVMAIGRDILCDSRIVFRKLEEVFPGGLNTDDGLTTLLDTWSMEILFPAAAMLIPVERGLADNAALIKDREEFSGRSWSREFFKSHRAEGAATMRSALTFIDKSLLKDKTFIGGDKPSLADIQAVWLIDWLRTMEGALDNTSLDRENFPRIFAWNDRFRAAVGGYKAAKSVKGEEARQIIMAGSSLPSIGIDTLDPLGFKEGEQVSVAPLDSAQNHPTFGALIGINTDEVVVRVRTGLPVHFPRRAFKIKRVDEGKL